MREVEVEAAGFEVGGESEVEENTEATGDTLGDLEQAVEGLNGGVGQAGLHEGNDSVKVGFDGGSELAEGFEPGAGGPAAPPVQGVEVGVGEHILEGLAQSDGTADFGIVPTELLATGELVLGSGPGVAAQAPESAAEIGSVAPQVLAHLVTCLAGQLHEMEVIENDARGGKILLGSGDVGRAHVHDDLGDLAGVGSVSGHDRGELRQRLGVTTFDHEQKLAGVGIEHDSDVAMPATCARFIHENAAHRAPIPGGMGRAYVIIDHSPEPLVGLPQMPGSGRNTHLLGQQHDHGLHHQRKPAATPRPRHADLEHPMLVAGHSRHPRLEFGAVLPEIQMPPLLFYGVMHRTGLPASRASKAAAYLKIELQLQLPTRSIHRAFHHFPSLPQPQRLSK